MIEHFNRNCEYVSDIIDTMCVEIEDIMLTIEEKNDKVKKLTKEIGELEKILKERDKDKD